MFEKLLSVLPSNPGISNQLAFYARRMREESAIRRVGMFFIVLAFFVQFFAVLSPPQSTVADSTNDLVNHGFTSAADAAHDCQLNTPVNGGPGYGTILKVYGISCADVAAAPTITINASGWNRQLWSMGRNNYPIAGETPVNVAGSTLYIRYLWGWGPSVNYQALNVTKPGGQTVFLLFSCGNITSVGQPIPAPTPPVLSITKTTAAHFPTNGSVVRPGDVLSYQLTINNTGGPASNVTIRDNLPPHTSDNAIFKSNATSGAFDGAGNASFVFSSVPAGATDWYVGVRFKVNANAPNGSRICNTATLSSNQTPTQTTQPPICMTVKVNAPPPPVTPPPPPPPCKQAVGSQNPFACVVPSKSASNQTQQLPNANGTTAQAGDVIIYTLNAHNSGTSTVKNYVFKEDMSDVLDYATITNLHGGKLDASGTTVSWPAVTIAAGATASQQITVQVKNPIPQTPPSSSDPLHFDLKMMNTYGNTVTISLPASAPQVVETTAAALPNTGPGTSLFVVAIVMVIGGYFYSRSRLLHEESVIAVQEAAKA